MQKIYICQLIPNILLTPYSKVGKFILKYLLPKNSVGLFSRKIKVNVKKTLI